MAKFWTRKRTQAALDVAEDVLTDEQIAARAGVKKWALEDWKRRPVFKARVDEHLRAFAEEIKRQGIANRQNRVDALNDRWRRLHQVIEARAADETMKGAGHETGLLVRTYKAGKLKLEEEYAVDTGLLSELRAHELQAAKELGQWSERAEVSGRDGARSNKRLTTRAPSRCGWSTTGRPPPRCSPSPSAPDGGAALPAPAARRPVGHCFAPREDQDRRDGAALGQNHHVGRDGAGGGLAGWEGRVDRADLPEQPAVVALG
jgi:hypothetical protein